MDIGTTTVAIQLYDLEKGECLGTYTGLNGQRTYGADVIARIQAAVEGKEEELTEKIRQELWKGMERLRKIHEISWEKVKKIAIAGKYDHDSSSDGISLRRAWTGAVHPLSAGYDSDSRRRNLP